MLILAIDTATSWGTIALCQDEQVILEVSLNSGKGGGEYLLALLNSLIAQSGYALSNVDLLVAGTGPGSYTGIRVGLATIKGLATGLDLPVHGISTLRIIAENARYVAEKVAVVIDARRNQVYAALYENRQGRLVEVEGPHITAVEAFREKILSTSGVFLLGDGSKVYQDLWRVNPDITIAPANWDRPLASLAARIAYQERDCQKISLEQLEPAYLRRVEAEVRLEERTHGIQSGADAARRPGGGCRD